MAVNGSTAELHPEITSKGGEVRPAPSRHERSYRLARPGDLRLQGLLKSYVLKHLIIIPIVL